MGGMSLIFTPVLVRHLLGPPSLSRPMTSISWTYSYSTPNTSIGRYNLPPAAHPPTPTTHPTHHPPPTSCPSMLLYVQSVILQKL